MPLRAGITSGRCKENSLGIITARVNHKMDSCGRARYAVVLVVSPVEAGNTVLSAMVRDTVVKAKPSGMMSAT